MIICTSISPNHKNYDSQAAALASWQKYGECFSLNNEWELPETVMEQYQGITFIPTRKTIQHLVGKSLVTINAFYDFAIERKRDLFLINSDIIVKDLPKLKQDGITIFSRYDFTDSIGETKMFIHGYDAFYIPYQFLKMFPPSIFALGACWHDLWTPYCCIKNQIPVYYPNGEFTFHKLHEVQYPVRDWELLGRFFQLEFGFDYNISVGQVNTQAMATISNHLLKY